MDNDNNQPDAATVTTTEPTPEQVADFEAKRNAERAKYATTVRRLPTPEIPPAEVEERRQEREAEFARRAQNRQRAEISQRFKDLLYAAGKRYISCTLESFQAARDEQRAVVLALREYVDEDCQDNVILYGPVGTGKDHLAFAVCREAVKTGKCVRWINGQSWFGIVRDAMDTDKSEASLIAELARPELLCLSDPLPPIGALTQFQATMLYRLVDARYARGVPTICTINVHDDAEADERMGEATWDRLCHDAWKLHCRWPSYRKPMKEL